MIQSELLDNDTLIRHWSTCNHNIMQYETGIIYREAIDAYPCSYSYIEVDENGNIIPPITMVGPNTSNYSEWDENTTYSIGEVCLYRKTCYVSLCNNNTDEPSTTENWAIGTI